MSEITNDLGQPIGFPVPDWQRREHPRGAVMLGSYCRLEPIDAVRHAADLFAAFNLDRDAHNWTYLPYGPFQSEAELRSWIETTCVGDDPCFFTVIDLASSKAVGVASYMRVDPANGVIEVSTEAMYLMMRQVFDVLGYRRYEWKCDALNQPSCNAALRLGFMFEGIFRQAVMYKGRNRDTAWYSILDREWPLARAAFESWLAPANFDGEGNQIERLPELMQSSLTPIR
jgi:RimJ/RimL family protein N-acetyltransferase